MINDNKNTSLAEQVKQAYEKLFIKILVYSEAYIFVLEGSVESANKLIEIAKTNATTSSQELDKNTIQASYLRLNKLLSQHNTNANEYFRSVLFIDLISSTEAFFAEIIKAVVAVYPQKIGKTQFELKDIVETTSLNDLIQRAADEYVYKLMYEKPEDYLEKICTTLSIDKNLIQTNWSTYIEAKARRDLGVHNNWKCNKTYLRKLDSQKIKYTCKEGETLMPIDREYCSQTSNKILEICKTMTSAVIEKHGKQD
ncbi:hypothetical protein [Hydrogenophaga pseudoflava]|uniref:hypothetical protein n=1 Tax=Hydrogenophaga pseudoflava TaxID=47421 RepID=UPI000AC6EFBA|nr:hypothetical protein [Hydrogenophaga pseudoflava]